MQGREEFFSRLSLFLSLSLTHTHTPRAHTRTHTERTKKPKQTKKEWKITAGERISLYSSLFSQRDMCVCGPSILLLRSHVSTLCEKDVQLWPLTFNITGTKVCSAIRIVKKRHFRRTLEKSFRFSDARSHRHVNAIRSLAFHHSSIKLNPPQKFAS